MNLWRLSNTYSIVGEFGVALSDNSLASIILVFAGVVRFCTFLINWLSGSFKC